MKKLETKKMEQIEGGSVKGCTAVGTGLAVGGAAFGAFAGVAALFLLGCALYDY